MQEVHGRGSNELKTLVPPEGNYVVAFSASEGYRSYEVRDDGGIWMKKLSEVVKEKGHCKSIMDILTDTNKELMKLYQDKAYKKALTQPECICKLQDTLYLVPQSAPPRLMDDQSSALNKQLSSSVDGNYSSMH